MHREGHVGMNLLVYAPVAFGLTWVGMVTPMAWGLLGMVLLSTLPDLDLYVPGVSHRGFTHTMVFALLVGTLLGGAGALLAYHGFGTSAGLSMVEIAGRDASAVGSTGVDASAEFSTLAASMLGLSALGASTAAGAAFGFAIGVLSVVGHLGGDVFTPMGVAPWKPFSGRRHSLGWFNADSSAANKLWLGVGIVLLLLAVFVGMLLRTGVLAVQSAGG